MVWFKKQSDIKKPEVKGFLTSLAELLPHPLRFAKELVSPGGPSVSRVVTLMTCVFLNIECLILTWARAKWKQPVSAELTIVIGLLSVLIGYVYHRSKTTEERKSKPTVEEAS